MFIRNRPEDYYGFRLGIPKRTPGEIIAGANLRNLEETLGRIPEVTLDGIQGNPLE